MAFVVAENWARLRAVALGLRPAAGVATINHASCTSETRPTSIELTGRRCRLPPYCWSTGSKSSPGRLETLNDPFPRILLVPIAFVFTVCSGTVRRAADSWDSHHQVLWHVYKHPKLGKS